MKAPETDGTAPPRFGAITCPKVTSSVSATAFGAKNLIRETLTRTCRPTRSLEVNDPFGLLLGGVEIVGVGAGREVLPTAVADDEDDYSFGDLRGDLRGPGQRCAGGDPSEDPAFVHEAPRPIEALAGANHSLSVEEVEAVPLLEHGRDVAVLDVAEALNSLTERRLDGDDLDVRILL